MSATRQLSKVPWSAPLRWPVCHRITSRMCCSTTCAACRRPVSSSVRLCRKSASSPTTAWVRIRDRATGAERLVTADYVLGADGAHSRTRSDIGIDRWSSGRLLEAVSVVFRAPLWKTVGSQRFGIYHVEHPEATGSFLPAGGNDRWLYSFLWDPEQEELADYSEAALVDLIRTGAGDPDLPVQIDSLGAFSFIASLATRFRLGRVFLIGDAAHQVTPRGGTGMNTAIADGFDLGWKLAWVLNGWHDDTLLDTYELERRPVAEHNVTRSIDPEGSRREVSYELSVDLGGRLRHLWLPHTRTSTLDLLGPGLTLLTTDESAERREFVPHPGPATGDRFRHRPRPGHPHQHRNAAAS